MGTGVRIARVLYEQMLAHCQSKYPKEACGILAGESGVVTHVYPMTNVEESPIGYSMDPKEQLLVEKQMRSRRHQMVGIYHSHSATEAFPSSVDVKLAISPEVSYLLVSLKDIQRPVMKSYRIDGMRVTEEPLTIADVLV
jgi:proteasome lid subunit RPN8/RPN11